VFVWVLVGNVCEREVGIVSVIVDDVVDWGFVGLNLVGFIYVG